MNKTKQKKYHTVQDDFTMSVINEQISYLVSKFNYNNTLV